jgi:alkylation response protein AidB-like acyl-CoA dehydrogenase
MILQPTPDQRALIDEAFARPLDELLPLDRLHKPDSQEPWSALAELGLFGIASAEELGGVGLSPVEEALAATELGARLAGPQVLAAIMATHLADDALRARIVAGDVRVAPAVLAGSQVRLFDADGAEFVLLRRAGEAALLPIAAFGNRALIDGHHWTAPIEAGSVPADIGWAPVEAVLRVRLVEAAALCGVAACARDMAVAYACMREQFGHPIGGFQAIKHRCADMAMVTRAATDQVTFAAVALDQGRGDAAFQVEAALLLAIDAALANARANVQIHGGIGFSDEADPHLVVKRAHLLVEAAGGADAAAERVAVGAPPMAQ